LGKVEEEDDHSAYTPGDSDLNDSLNDYANPATVSDKLSSDVKQLKHFIQSEFSYIFSQYLMTAGGAGS
jgi:hypothetical protein